MDFKINTSNLECKKYKNFKELCNALGIEKTPGGKQKIIFLQNLARYIKFEQLKNSQAYLVTEIYADPIPAPEDRRHQGNNSGHYKYSDLFEQCLDCIFYSDDYPKESDSGIILTRKGWYEALGMINPLFRKVTKTQDRNPSQIFMEQYNLDNEDFYIFKQRAFNLLKGIFTRALTPLSDSGNYLLCEYYTIIRQTSISNKAYQYDMATEQENELIQKCESRISEQNPDLKQKQYSKWADLVKKEVQKEFSEIDDCYQSYFPVIKIQNLKEPADYRIGTNYKETLSCCRQEINQMVVDRFTDSIKNTIVNEAENYENRKQKMQSEVLIGKIKESWVWKLPKGYETFMTTCVDKLIRLNQ